MSQTLDDGTPCRTLNIKGVSFTVIDRYRLNGSIFERRSVDGTWSPVTEQELPELRERVHVELAQNLRNAKQSDVNEVIEKYGTVEQIPANVMQELQDNFNAYRDSYEFGTRGGGGRGPQLTKIEAQGLAMCEAFVRSKMAAQGITNYTKANFDQYVEMLWSGEMGDTYHKAHWIAEAEKANARAAKTPELDFSKLGKKAA